MPVYFYILKVFLKKIIFLIFLDYFNALMLKIFLKK